MGEFWRTLLWPNDRIETPRMGETRGEYIKHHSWAIPSEKALKAIIKYSPNGCLELGAGNGFWTSLLRDRGLDVVAVDPQAKRVFTKWTEVEVGNHQMAARYPERSLLMVWPSNRKPWASQALGVYKGETVIYVGTPETEGPAKSYCATPGFFTRLKRDYELVETVKIPQWPGEHDRLEVWIR